MTTEEEKFQGMENEPDLEVEEIIDARPKKKTIINKAMRCRFENAMAEMIDNCLDYWADIEKPGPLEISIDIASPETEDSTVIVRWNMGVPANRWRPLLTPGDASHSSGDSIGVWGEGFKIAIFSTGKFIDIFTNNKGTCNQIHVPHDFLKTEDWKIKVFKGCENGIDVAKDTTIVRLKGRQYNDQPVDTKPLKDFIGETFGTRIMREEEMGYTVEIKVNGDQVPPTTYTSAKDIQQTFAFPPGYEPSFHVFYEDGMKITMLIGLLNMMDAENYGVYMYGNGRMFAKRMRNEVVGFGTRSNSPVPADHPTSKRIQIHVFFDGPPVKIPWQAPLKDQVIERDTMVGKVAELIKVHAAPYAQFMVRAQNPEFVAFSERWNGMSEEDRKNAMLTNDDRKKLRSGELTKEMVDEQWEKLPAALKTDFVAPKIVTWDHGEYNKARKPVESPKFDKRLGKGVMDLLKERHDGKIMSFELLPKLIKLAGDEDALRATQRPSVRVPKGDEPEQGGITPLFGPEERSITLSVRMDAAEANELQFLTGEMQKSGLLRAVIDSYKAVQDLKKHPFLRSKRPDWTDEELLEEVRTLLNERASAR